MGAGLAHALELELRSVRASAGASRGDALARGGGRVLGCAGGGGAGATRPTPTATQARRSRPPRHARGVPASVFPLGECT